MVWRCANGGDRAARVGSGRRIRSEHAFSMRAAAELPRYWSRVTNSVLDCRELIRVSHDRRHEGAAAPQKMKPLPLPEVDDWRTNAPD